MPFALHPLLSGFQEPLYRLPRRWGYGGGPLPGIPLLSFGVAYPDGPLPRVEVRKMGLPELASPKSRIGVHPGQEPGDLTVPSLQLLGLHEDLVQLLLGQGVKVLRCLPGELDPVRLHLREHAFAAIFTDRLDEPEVLRFVGVVMPQFIHPDDDCAYVRLGPPSWGVVGPLASCLLADEDCPPGFRGNACAAQP